MPIPKPEQSGARLTASVTPRSKLPEVGTTIFTVMSALAQAHGAINLSQGFPDFDPDPALLERVAYWMGAGKNQYPPMAGVPALREAIAAKLARCYGLSVDPESEITVTAGATQALFSAIHALVHPGDEVILFEPAYDSYAPAVRLAGGVVRYVSLLPPTYTPDWGTFDRCFSARTRLVVVNTPHNPTGAIWREADWAALAERLDGSDAMVLADEVYEHIVFDGARHESVLRQPGLAGRALAVFSFGKTFHVTGWKIGYVVGAAPLMAEFRRVHQFDVFTVSHAEQWALADYLAEPAHYEGLAAFYQQKRDRLRGWLTQAGFTLLPAQGTYFQLAHHPDFRHEPDTAFVRWLTETVGVAAIPVSAFYHDHRDDGVIRFCFAKRDETLDAAGQRLVAGCGRKGKEA
ncbi:methionine aminotransferase [Hydrogenophilus thermoluteolus]|uniref:Aminotransferase n=1 Tax=Hydrogenophilus thermoluteolus TaxID=297 RepID=A0A2Z6DWJ2_HYDTE|nr:aminotransferase [Hydrogenophilus thermoluteolus]